MPPSRRDTHLVVIIVEFIGIPVASLPFKTWKELKDTARSALDNHHEPGETEVSRQSADGRTVGFVRCKTVGDADKVYNRMVQLYYPMSGRVHYYDTERGGLVRSTHPGGHSGENTQFDTNIMASSVTFAHHAGVTPNPYAYSSGTFDNLANDMSALTVDNGASRQIPYHKQFPAALSQSQYGNAYRSGNTVYNYNANATAPYGHAPQFVPEGGSAAPGYPAQTVSAALYPQPNPYTSGYASLPQAYPGQAPQYLPTYSAYPHANAAAPAMPYGNVQVGYSPASQAYVTVSQENGGHTSASRIASHAPVPVEPEFEPVTLVYRVLLLKNLDPRTGDHEVKKVLDKLPKCPDYHLQVNRPPAAKTKISAVVTLQTRDAADHVLHQWQKKQVTIRKRLISLEFGKPIEPVGYLASKTTGPMVVSSS